MNENGRRAINDILSEAAISGYYRQSRIDLELIMSLPEADVIVTTACVGFWRYENVDDIVLKLHHKFKNNFYLEVQYHNTEKQRELNKHILFLKNKHNIQLIMGCDSHFIDEKGCLDRDEFIKSKGIFYEDEQGWYLDYPDGDTAYKRFADQCVLSHDEIFEAISNTNIFLNVEEYDCPIFGSEVKMPTLYPDKTQEEKDKIYEELIWEKWENYKKEVPKELWGIYKKEIAYEIDIVKKTYHADYFLLDYAIVNLGKKKGGRLSLTGRGSAVSFITNKLLGFTDVDRIAAKVKMYPERFMSPTRILETHSLADIDMNVAEQEPFWEAQEDITGYEHSKQMIAFQQLKPPAAWKMYAKSQDVDFETANAVSEQIKKWQKDVARADEDSKDDIDIYDYIEPRFHEIYKKSEDYLGVISSVSPHPCASLIYMGDIRKEIGYIYVKPKEGEGRVCCCMDGKWAEKYGFLKNDWLKVNVVKAIFNIFDRIGIPPISVNQLLKECTPENLAWTMYAKQCTYGLNQVEQPGTASRVAKYGPLNISELTAFVAAIRPGFKSMYKVFESKEHFDYNIPTFDKLIQTDEMPNTFVLYQEQAMATLNYAGIPMSECYAVIKSIAKKRTNEVLQYKKSFILGFTQKIVNDEQIHNSKAEEIAYKVWQIIEDSSRYSFNASHAYCVALDSLYGAWLKVYHPLEFYEVYLNILNEKGDKDRLNKFKAEAEHYFRILFPPYRFGQDNRKITLDKDNNAINNALSSIKGYSNIVGESLYYCSKETENDFFQILKWLDNKSIKSKKILPLIKIDYFRQFGNVNQLIEAVDIFDLLKQGNAKQLSKDKIKGTILAQINLEKYCTGKNKDGSDAKNYKIIDMDGLLKLVWFHISNMSIPDITLTEKMIYQKEYLDYIDLTTGKKEDIKKVIITDIKPLFGKYSSEPWAYRVETRSLGTGKSAILNIKTYTYQKYGQLKKLEIIKIGEISKNDKGYWYVYDYEKIS